MPVYNINVFNRGGHWPPRLINNTWGEYHRYSQGDYVGLTDLKEPRLTPNLFRFIENFWAEAVVSEPPVIEYEGGTQGVADIINKIGTRLPTTMRQIVRHMIRYGVGVFYNRIAYQPQVIDPRFWFPVTQPQYVEQTGVDVVAYPYATDPLRPIHDRLHVAVNESGGAEIREHLLEGATIGRVLSSETAISGDPATVPVTEDGSLFGESDFVDIIPYVAELQRRGTGISEALDAHARPHIALPDAAFDVQNNGTPAPILDEDGSMIPFPEGSALPAYVTWDAKFEAHSGAMTDADLRVLRMARISPVLVNQWERTGQLASGAALRRMAVPTVQRIRVIRAVLSLAAADTIAGNAAMLETPIQVDPEKIKFTWPVPLGTGITDDAEAIIELVQAGLLDRNAAIRLLNHVSGDEAERIMQKYLENEAGLEEIESHGLGA